VQLAHNGVAIDSLVEPQKPVGHREHCAVALAVCILPDEEGRVFDDGDLQERELTLRQLCAADEQRLDAGSAKERIQVSMELVVDAASGCCTLARAAGRTLV
jgi:hypothetical protein